MEDLTTIEICITLVIMIVGSIATSYGGMTCAFNWAAGIKSTKLDVLVFIVGVVILGSTFFLPF